MTDYKQAAAGILVAARHMDDEGPLIDAINVWTRQLRDRDQLERLIDHLGVTLAIVVADIPVDQVDRLADALRQGNPK